MFRPPATSWPTRPTTDIAKEALYNILANRIDFSDVSMLDLFCGTGAHTFEFLSRGSIDVTCVDKFDKCIKWIKEQVKELEEDNACSVNRMDVSKYIKTCDRTFDVIFADPPYALRWLQGLPNMILDRGMLAKDGWLIIEHGSDVLFDDHLQFVEVRKYGQSRFSFFQN